MKNNPVIEQVMQFLRAWNEEKKDEGLIPTVDLLLEEYDTLFEYEK